MKGIHTYSFKHFDFLQLQPLTSTIGVEVVPEGIIGICRLDFCVVEDIPDEEEEDEVGRVKGFRSGSGSIGSFPLICNKTLATFERIGVVEGFMISYL